MPTNLTEIYQQLAQKIDAQKTEITNGGFSTAEIALGLILAM